MISIGCNQKKTYLPSDVNGYSKTIRDIDIQLELLFYQKKKPNPERSRSIQVLKESQSERKELIKKLQSDQPERAQAHEKRYFELSLLLERSHKIKDDKIDELLLQRQELINKYNIDTRICDIHKTPLHQTTIKYRGNYLSNEQGYINSLEKIFPNSNEPYTRPMGKLGFISSIKLNPKEIQINICSECNQARNKWFNDNNIKEISFREWLAIDDRNLFYQSILDSLTPMNDTEKE